MKDPNHYANMYNSYEKNPKKIRVLDSTLREGEQHPGVSFTNKQQSDIRTKLRLGFNSPSTIRRQILATIDQRASINYDWGFDSKYIDEQVDDMYWMINDEKYVIQGLNEFTPETILPLGIHTKKASEIKITIDKHNDCYYVYRMEDQTFMAQGKTRNELEHSLMKLFPGKKFACTHDNLVEVGFAE